MPREQGSINPFYIHPPIDHRSPDCKPIRLVDHRKARSSPSAEEKRSREGGRVAEAVFV